MCTNEQNDGNKNNAYKTWGKERFFVSFLVCGLISVCFFYIGCRPLLGMHATLKLSCVVFLACGVMLTEILWIMDLHKQYSEKKEKKQEYAEEIVKKITGKEEQQTVEYVVFLAEKADHNTNNLPLLIAVGSLCVSSLNAVDGSLGVAVVTIFLFILVYGFSVQKRIYAIEDAVKEYAFKKALK